MCYLSSELSSSWRSVSWLSGLFGAPNLIRKNQDGSWEGDGTKTGNRGAEVSQHGAQDGVKRDQASKTIGIKKWYSRTVNEVVDGVNWQGAQTASSHRLRTRLICRSCVYDSAIEPDMIDSIATWIPSWVYFLPPFERRWKHIRRYSRLGFRFWVWRVLNFVACLCKNTVWICFRSWAILLQVISKMQKGIP